MRPGCWHAFGAMILLGLLLAGCATSPRMVSADHGGWPPQRLGRAWPAYVVAAQVTGDRPTVKVGNLTCDVRPLDDGRRLLVPQAISQEAGW